VLAILNRLTAGFLAFSGVIAESMTRGQAWRFLDMGNRIERAVAVARLVKLGLTEVVPEEFSILDALLEITDSSLTYRRRYLTQLEAPAVVDLIVADESNPRAVAFQVVAIEEHLAHLPREAAHPQRSPDRLAALKLRTQLKLADLNQICQPAQRTTRPGLEALMTEVNDGMAKVSEWVSQIYFSHAAVPWSLQGAADGRRK
jgi:uncharacterized alpha-E superfamily protein